jgi:DNA repair protein RadA/Sms
MRIGKSRNIPVFIVAHVTKSGDLAGPKIVEHLVDCVLSITGERNAELRILRSYKNRFGTTSEIGAFEMAESGLIEITDLSKRFLQGAEERAEGAMIGAAYEGTRPLLFEVQALAASTNMNYPRRTSIGFDYGRLNMILAVLERRVGLRLSDQDVYVNVVGGLHPDGTSVDLAVAMAVWSSVRGIVWDKDMMAIGEIGLTGDLRPVQNAEKIVREAVRMGFGQILLPASQADAIRQSMAGAAGKETVRIIGVKRLSDILHK